MNPNNQAYQDSTDNRADQLNPNNDAFWSSRGLNGDDEDDDSIFECDDFSNHDEDA